MIPILFIILGKNRYGLHDLVAFSGHHTYPNKIEDEDTEYYEICSQQFDTSIKSFFLKMTVILCAAGVAFLNSGYYMISHGVIETGTRLKIPFTDENSLGELFVNLFIISNILGHGLLGYIAIEAGIDITVDFILLSRKLLEYRLRKLDKQIKTKRLTDSQIFSTLRIIVQNLRDFDKCVVDLQIIIRSD